MIRQRPKRPTTWWAMEQARPGPAMFADGVRNVVAGASSIGRPKRAIGALRELSRPVRTRKEKAQVGAISAPNDPAIGELVADAMDKVLGDGVITVEESKTTRQRLTSSKACNSIAASCLGNSSPIRKRWSERGEAHYTCARFRGAGR
jgi:hypothetical protein